jgi:hypothetical protein
VIWNKLVYIKVYLFVWQLFSNQLPTKDNLLRCGVPNVVSILCTSGVIQLKLLIDHLFFECCYFGGILYEVLRWFGFSLVLSIGVVPHATQFSHSYLFGKNVCLVLILFGLLVVGPYGNTHVMIAYSRIRWCLMRLWLIKLKCCLDGSWRLKKNLSFDLNHWWVNLSVSLNFNKYRIFVVIWGHFLQNISCIWLFYRIFCTF